MLEFIVIFSKGGVVLWSYNPYNGDIVCCFNNLIRNIILEEKSTDGNYYEHENIAIQFKFDNEYELVFAAGFQKTIQLPYVSILLNDLQVAFKRKYKDVLTPMQKFANEYDFHNEFKIALSKAINTTQSHKATQQMRTFNESSKSQKNVSLIIDDKSKNETKKNQQNYTSNSKEDTKTLTCEELILENRKKLKDKLNTKKSTQQKKKLSEQDKVGKKPRVWELEGSAKDAIVLDRSKSPVNDVQYQNIQSEIVGTMQGRIRDLELDNNVPDPSINNKKKPGLLSYFKGIVGSKILTRSDMQPALDKMRDHLIEKNVAADIAGKLCDSVAANLEGKSLGTLDSTASVVKNSLASSLLRILSPKRRIDILRDALESKKNNVPYVIIFCGVNGVGKSTNLAKICFWLIENDFNVLIAACDTFRAGAVEQLRTHTRHINALHPAEKHNNRTMVQLYERGYGKDAAGIAMEAIKYAAEMNINVVLIDTAGRMQDNEPLMRSLSKLIKVNNPDLVLFVGEALVGNEAVDQLVKFNQSLADFSSDENPHIIDGIVLTKFDTVDDKVGAAISMTYVTGQPIVFVGTGQTYSDLKALNVETVVHSLMK